MGDVVFRRGRASGPPPLPGGRLELQAPPALPRITPQPLVTRLMPAVMVVAVLGSVLVMVQGGMARNPMVLMFPLMMVVSTVGMLAGSTAQGNRAAETDELRKDYLRYLDQVRRTVEHTAAEQRRAANRRHPDPTELLPLVGGDRMWEREPEDVEFLTMRLGPGRQALATGLHVPDTGPVADLEPVSVEAMRRFVRVHSVVDGLPVALDLRGSAVVSLDGPAERVRSGVRAMLCGLAVTHGPDRLRIAVAAGEGETRQAWEWLKWLPHHQHPTYTDGGGRVRLTEFSVAGVEAMLAEEMTGAGAFTPGVGAPAGRPHLLLVVDGVDCTGAERLVVEEGLAGVTVVEISGSRAGHLRALAVRRGMCLQVDGDRVRVLTATNPEEVAALDTMSVPEAERLAMAMARYRPAENLTLADGSVTTRRAPGLTDLLGVGPAGAVDPAVVWRRRTARERLRVPVGVTPEGAPVELDLKEAAHGGMGPHGLCIGATGSGKSEFLRTLVLGLVTTHDPDSLNLVLVDFKGGATFLGLEHLAHVSAVITNLQAEITMVDRMRDALEGELTRRQEVLRAAGNYANVGDYEAARQRGEDLAPLPALFVVVDEFSELLSARPEFVDIFLAIGRLGRSLHIHLLLASQRLEEGRLRGLDSHLSYRVALKTFSATESRSVLGVTDAYHLPATPGAGFLKVDSGTPVRFDAAYVSGPCPMPGHPDGERGGAVVSAPAPRPFTSWYMPVPVATGDVEHRPEPDAPTARDTDTDEGSTVLQVLVGRLVGHGRPAHEVWLPPLGAGAPLDSVVGSEPVADSVDAGVRLRLPVAEVDLPFEQRRDIWWVDLAAGAGNVAVVGGSRSGKSTAVATLVLGAAVCNSPDRLWVYCVDLGGGALAPLAGLPHVGGVAHRGDPERIRRTVAEVAGELRRRQAAFHAAGIVSVEQARGRTVLRQGRKVAEFPDILLVVDGWQVLRTEFEDLEQTVTAMAADGLAFGVHVLVTSSRWAGVRPALRDALGTRIELRLGDPTDSMIDRRSAMGVPEASGRGLTPDRHHMLVLQPRLDGQTRAEGLQQAGAEAVRSVAERWRALVGPLGAEPVRMLPDELPWDHIASLARPETDGPRRRVPFGIDERDLQVAYADFEVDPLLLVFGDTECGKTSMLRSICRSLVAGNSPESAKLVIVDYRRGLLGEVEGDHLAGYAATESTLVPMIDHLVQILARRAPGPEVTPQQLRERSWWSGPHIYLVVDDLDLVITSAGNPLLPLVEHLPHARDIGFSLVAARRSAGASRVLYDPVVGRMRDLGAAGFVMSGSREEGPLVAGVRPAALPPGRGRFVTRSGGARLVQSAWCPP